MFFHDAFIIRYVAYGGTSGTICFLWYPGSDYNYNIAIGINYPLLLQIKIVKNFCNMLQLQKECSMDMILATISVT